MKTPFEEILDFICIVGIVCVVIFFIPYFADPDSMNNMLKAGEREKTQEWVMDCSKNPENTVSYCKDKAKILFGE